MGGGREGAPAVEDAFARELAHGGGGEDGEEREDGGLVEGEGQGGEVGDGWGDGEEVWEVLGVV